MDLGPSLGAWRDWLKVTQPKPASCLAHPSRAIPWKSHRSQWIVCLSGIPGDRVDQMYSATPGLPSGQPPHSQTHCIPILLLLLPEAWPARSSPHTPALHSHAGKLRQGHGTLMRRPQWQGQACPRRDAPGGRSEGWIFCSEQRLIYLFHDEKFVNSNVTPGWQYIPVHTHTHTHTHIYTHTLELAARSQVTPPHGQFCLLNTFILPACILAPGLGAQ